MKKIGMFVQPSCKGISGDALILCKRNIVDSENILIEENSIVICSLSSIDDSEKTELITINKFLEQIPNSFHVERTVIIRALIKIGLDIDSLNESAWINCFG